jgi:hypothetical protein
VNIAVDGDRAFVRTFDTAWKLKRIRNNPVVEWIIVAYNLWERPADREARDQAALYNAATALTLSVTVLFSYAVLFVLVLVAAVIFLDSGFLQSMLQHPVGLVDYTRG